jgi:hypothetical protein
MSASFLLAFPAIVPLLFAAWLAPPILLAVARRGVAAVSWLAGAVAVHFMLGVASTPGLILLFAALAHGVLALAGRPRDSAPASAQVIIEAPRKPFTPQPPPPPMDALTMVNLGLAMLAMIIFSMVAIVYFLPQ